ncbi:protein serine/threonine phosphatase 2C [Phlegmacium glaucopus]|nr:protein serine/threonine phosphatase 2C [Phlegmacium glaucopus]
MLRRILRSLPTSSYKYSPILRQRTIIAPLRPSLLMFLAVSATTAATIITIHGDADQPPNKPEKPAASVQMPLETIFGDLMSHRNGTPPPPTADETFDLHSDSEIPKEEATGVSRIDGILLPSNSPVEDTVQHVSIRFSSALNYSLFGVYDGHNGKAMSKFLSDGLILAVLGELAQLYSEHAAVSNPEHVDVEKRFSFVVNDIPDGDQQLKVKDEPELIRLHDGVPDPNPSEEELDQSIKKAFIALDSLIVDEMTAAILNERTSKEAGVRLLALANAGSCAVLGIYNSFKRTFKVAVTGDSRAVLGRRVALKGNTYAYETHVLSEDQNAHNPREVELLQAAHPGENVVQNGRVLGWGISRAFGDATLKWSREIQQRIHEQYLGDRPEGDCLTPPYFTAEPEITTTTIRKGDFVVLASDGLWDCLTNEEVVGLVGGWLETRGEEVKIGKGQGVGEGEMVVIPFGKAGLSGRNAKKGFGKGKGYGWTDGSDGGTSKEAGNEDERTIWERTDLPVTSLNPDQTGMYKFWRATKRFVNIDANVAVHLARNALGGADRDLTGALLRLKPPRSRSYRDDISIQVVFFD